MKIAINASPITLALFQYPLELVDYFIINEIEGQAIAGTAETNYEKILEALLKKFPQTTVVLTLGSEGVLYGKGADRARHGIFRVTAVDTTAAGDTNGAACVLCELLAVKLGIGGDPCWPPAIHVIIP